MKIIACRGFVTCLIVCVLQDTSIRRCSADSGEHYCQLQRAFVLLDKWSCMLAEDWRIMRMFGAMQIWWGFSNPPKQLFLVLLHAEFEHWVVFTWFRVIKHALRVLWLPKCWFACLALYRVKGWLIEMGVILITCPCWRDVVVSNFGNRLRNNNLFLAAKANLSAFCSTSFMWKPLYAQGNFDRVHGHRSHVSGKLRLVTVPCWPPVLLIDWILRIAA